MRTVNSAVSSILALFPPPQTYFRSPTAYTLPVMAQNRLHTHRKRQQGKSYSAVYSEKRTHSR